MISRYYNINLKYVNPPAGLIQDFLQRQDRNNKWI
jgi:hypothetical protein